MPESCHTAYPEQVTKVLGTLTAMLTAVLTALALLVVPAASADVSNAGYFSNQTPYGDQASSSIATAPAGYSLNFLQTVGRHGARSLTSDAAEVRALALWNKARKKGALTTVGRGFARDLGTFQKAEKKIGYGRLSTVGATEWRGIGRRTAENYRGFFDEVKAAGEPLAFATTSVARTQQSASAMKVGLGSVVPGLDVDNDRVSSSMLIESGSTKKGRAAIATALSGKGLKERSRHVLRRLYSASFVKSIKDPVSAALDIYLLYCTAPGMAGDTRVTFATYVPAADRPALAQAKDTQNFYRYGPGITGERSSFAKADPILKNFFDQIDARLEGGSTAAVFRLAHGETTMPFAARIKAPGSQTQSKAFGYRSNPWRGFVAGRLAGNIEWALYRADGRTPLVTMRYNEQPVKFNASCRATTGYFYAVAELKRCLR